MCQMDIYVLFATDIVDPETVFRDARGFVNHVQILFNASRKQANIIKWLA